MHVGRTEGPALQRPLLSPPGGAISPDGRIAGCYVHGLFATAPARTAFLAQFGATAQVGDYGDVVDRALDEIAEALVRSFDIPALLAIARG
jgi:adenosylcobyric acid synthase